MRKTLPVSFAFALAIGQAAQIQTGYYIGKGWVSSILNRVQIYFSGICGINGGNHTDLPV